MPHVPKKGVGEKVGTGSGCANQYLHKTLITGEQRQKLTHNGVASSLLPHLYLYQLIPTNSCTPSLISFRLFLIISFLVFVYLNLLSVSVKFFSSSKKFLPEIFQFFSFYTLYFSLQCLIFFISLNS